MTKKADLLKRDLKKVVQEILQGDDDDLKVEKIEEASTILGSLKELNKSIVPDKFKCPISKNLMKDPVVAASGETFDRSYIQMWLDKGNRLCPKTQQVLSNTFLAPNYLVREMISQWCKKRGLELPRPVTDEEGITHADREDLTQLLEKMSSSLSEQKKAAKKIQLLTKKMPSFRALITECADAISQLLSPLIPKVADAHPDLQENIIATIYNVSIQDDNTKRIVAENPNAIPTLVSCLESGTMTARANAVAALLSLASLERNKFQIGRANAIKPLIEHLGCGDMFVMRDAASAIYSLCLMRDNLLRAVSGGAVRAVMKNITGSVLVDEMVSILALLSEHSKAAVEMVELKAVPCLLNIIKETTCESNKEKCVAILCVLCCNDSIIKVVLKDIGEEEKADGTITKVALSGTSRAQRKANDILKMLNKAGGASASVTHTSA